MSKPIIVALHGVGSSGRDMATALAPISGMAEVIALDGSEPFDGGGPGRQWFSVTGITEGNRPGRVSEALPALVQRLDTLAQSRGKGRDDLVLLGFSQGAIMTIAMVAQGLHGGRAIAVAGRRASPVRPAAASPGTLLLVHDFADQVIPVHLSEETAIRLAKAGHRVDLTHTNGVGHGIGIATRNAIAAWLDATAPQAASIEGYSS